MLPKQQELLLGGLRKQLDALAAAGLLSSDQISEFKQLAATHDRCATVKTTIVPKLDGDFEVASRSAFPDKVTASNIRLRSLSQCKRDLNMFGSPDAKQPTHHGSSSGKQPRGQSAGGENNELSLTGSMAASWDYMSSFGGDPEAGGGGGGVGGAGGLPPLPSLYTIIDPPEDTDEITAFIQKHQNGKCGNCSKSIDRGSLGFGAYKARFCHELNMFCCEACHNGSCRVMLPSYAMLRWDFAPKPVRNSYALETEMLYQKPVLCPGAENPAMFDQLPILQDLRRLRLQLSKLHEIGASCQDFIHALVTEPERPVLGASAPATAGKASFFVSERQRYLITESEMWSLVDLAEVHRSVPTPTMAIAASQKQQKVPFAKFLQTIRDSMIRHCISECPECKIRAAHICLECKAEQTIYSFDVRNVVECARCTAVFHRPCWEAIQKAEKTCPGCSGKTVEEL